MEYRAADIFVRNIYAGKLQETEDGYRFTYAADYLAMKNPAQVSITLPLREEPYVSKTLFSFFDGLIPEGWLLDVVTHNWKIDQRDRFGLLLIACRDCIGNVTVQEAKE